MLSTALSGLWWVLIWRKRQTNASTQSPVVHKVLAAIFQSVVTFKKMGMHEFQRCLHTLAIHVHTISSSNFLRFGIYYHTTVPLSSHNREISVAQIRAMRRAVGQWYKFMAAYRTRESSTNRTWRQRRGRLCTYERSWCKDPRRWSTSFLVLESTNDARFSDSSLHQMH